MASRNLSGTNGGNGFSELDSPNRQSLSADGRYVIFQSTSNDLVTLNSNAVAQIYRRDLRTGVTEMVSVNMAGTGGGASSSYAPIISGNGRFVAFDSLANDLVSLPTPGLDIDVFVRDMQTGVTRLVSINAAGTGGANRYSEVTSISHDGRIIAFQSFSTILTPTPVIGPGEHAFARDMQTNTTYLLDINSAGTASGNERVYNPQVSRDGSAVVFESDASDLSATVSDANSGRDIFVRDLQANTTKVISISTSNTTSTFTSANPSISATGRFVVFSNAGNDIAGTGGGVSNVYLRDLQTNTTELISINAAGNNGGNNSSFVTNGKHDVTPDGRFVAFHSAASNLITTPTDNNFAVDVFVRDRQTNTTRLVSFNAAGNSPANSASYAPLISDDARFVAFTSNATNLTLETKANFGEDVFIRDLLTNTTRLVSVNKSCAATGNLESLEPAMSDDGRVVVFQSEASDLVDVDTNGRPDVFASVTNNRRTLFDFDGDGKADISVFRQSNGTWYLSRSTQGFTATQFGIATDKLVPADYDNDGTTDVAVFRDGAWYILESSNGQLRTAQFGASGDLPVPADYDGDGKADLAVFRQGTWYVSESSTNQLRVVQFGTGGDVPVAADYDGDGKADVAVFRGGNWYLLRSTAGFTAIEFGLSTDVAVPADYDGDGKADVAVFRNGLWYAQQSTAGFSGIQFGAMGDLPVAADYDGDGKTDVAVFRQGTWYLQLSQAGFTAIQFGQNGDVAVPAARVP